jgi:hypothetical protein
MKKTQENLKQIVKIPMVRIIEERTSTIIIKLYKEVRVNCTNISSKLYLNNYIRTLQN